MHKQITKRELKKLLRQDKTRKSLAYYYGVSTRTVDRRVKEFNLLGIAKQGKRPLPRKPEEIRFKRFSKVWSPTKDYINRLNGQYHFVNIERPPYRYVNQNTLISSNQPMNPRGFFTTAGIYFIAYVSNVYFLYAKSIRYSQNPKPLKEIYNWIKENALTILEESLPPNYVVVRSVAYTFSIANHKPKAIRYG